MFGNNPQCFQTLQVVESGLFLVQNACEAIAPGEAVTCRICLTDQGHACLQIHNGGLPIPPEVLPRLTQPFCSTKVGGTGLGLAVVRRIMDAHRGNLTIESTQGAGTVVTLTFPVIHGQDSTYSSLQSSLSAHAPNGDHS